MRKANSTGQLAVVLAAVLLCALFNARTVLADDTPTTTAATLKEGTEVDLKFADAISSKTAAVDDDVTLVLADDLKVGNVTVARAGAKALATVTNVKKAGMMGKAGELNIRLEYLKAGDVKVHLRGNKGREGEGKEGQTVALTVLFGPIGLIKHGKNIDIPAGAPLKGYVADDISLPPAP
jgi:hypothetical protein